MADAIRVSGPISGTDKTLSFETGKLAQQSQGAVLAGIGRTLFPRRKARPPEAPILTCRLTDRPLRPAFPDGFRNETQVVLTVLGADMANPHDVISINAASAALMI